MARKKNALRQHLIAPYNEGGKPTETDYLPLARWISNIADASDESTEVVGYYDGDGTEEEDVLGIAEAYDISGTYDPSDAAQEMIAGMKHEIGDGRKCWHKIISSDGMKEWEGIAVIKGIIAGSGDATGFEEFGCTIRYNQIPEKTTSA